MTTLRQAAQAALEALESVLCDPEGKAGIRGSDADNAIIDAALDALRAALAEPQPQPEPVATEFHNPWRASLENCISGDNYLRSREYHELIEELDDLYRMRLAAPQAQQPLTDEQIAKVICQATGWTGPHSVFFNLVRAIERAHGIGMKP